MKLKEENNKGCEERFQMQRMGSFAHPAKATGGVCFGCIGIIAIYSKIPFYNQLVNSLFYNFAGWGDVSLSFFSFFSLFKH